MHHIVEKNIFHEVVLHVHLEKFGSAVEGIVVVTFFFFRHS